ncbi:MAG: FHA domain-containing protein [Stomatobaculum sp.]|nr:FHA domain-containing protein [Stomatobaculum sp.]
MKLTKCANGHFYDGDTYQSCPFCSAPAPAASNETIPLDYAPSAVESVTVAMTESFETNETQKLDVNPKPADSGRAPLLNDDSKTISLNSYFPEGVADKSVEPVVGWLVCTEGKLYGRDFRLKSGRNFIGRDSSMDVCLAGEMTVSRDRHAILVYEPRGNMFLAMPGETKELVYLNGKVVLIPTEMKKNDEIQIGEVTLMLIPFCDDVFTWKK